MKFKHALLFSIIISSILYFIGISNAHAEESKPAYSMEGMTKAMQKSMDPNVWTQMMAMMMNPTKASAMESCALCHEGEDLARYQKDFGPMMEMAFNMYKPMSPHGSMQYMGPAMNMMNPAMMGGMMNPMMYMNMMYPMMGMMGPMMGMMGPMMNPMGMMAPMMNPMGMMGGYNAANPMGNVMDPKQYEQWFKQWTDMMQSFTPKQTN